MNLRYLILLPSLLLALLIVAGCQTPPNAAEGSLAWVEIDGRTRDEIKQATVEVFKGSGYRMKTNTLETATFEKPGSTANNLAYGGWDNGVTIRVIVHITIQPNGTHLLHSEVFMVRDAGDRLVEEARPIHHRRRPYQELLDRVNRKLQSDP